MSRDADVAKIVELQARCRRQSRDYALLVREVICLVDDRDAALAAMWGMICCATELRRSLDMETNHGMAR